MNKPPTTKQIKRARALRAHGFPLKEIASEVGLCIATTHKYVKDIPYNTNICTWEGCTKTATRRDRTFCIEHYRRYYYVNVTRANREHAKGSKVKKYASRHSKGPTLERQRSSIEIPPVN